MIDDFYKNASSYIETLQKISKIKSSKGYVIAKAVRHISQGKLKRLVSHKIIELIDHSNLNSCIECIKEKQTHIRKFSTNRILMCYH